MFISRANAYSAEGYTGAAQSRSGIVGTVAVHALLVGGYFLIPADVIKTYVPGIIIGTNVPLPPPPPENPVEKPAAKKPLQKSVEKMPFIPDQTIEFSRPTETLAGSEFPGIADGAIVDIKPEIVEPLHAPVLTAVTIDPRYARNFQPDYPPAMQRAQEEGKVTVKVTIGPDGHVTAVERLFATSEAFWNATRSQALDKWRFRPATRDGVPVESEKVMTVHFQLN